MENLKLFLAYHCGQRTIPEQRGGEMPVKTLYASFFFRDLISYCWYNPQPMRNDHSIAGTTILQTTLEDADSTQFYWWLDKSGGKGSSWTSRRFGVQHHRQSVAMKGKVGLNLLFLSWLLSDDGVEHRNVLRSNYYLYHRIYLTINKIVYYQHLLVSFEELLSLRLSDHFALVVGCINNNWLNPRTPRNRRLNENFDREISDGWKSPIAVCQHVRRYFLRSLSQGLGRNKLGFNNLHSVLE